MPEKDKLPSLKETYEKDDKNPFGGNVAFNGFLNFFQNVNVVYGDVFTVDSDSAEEKRPKRSLYVMIGNKLYFGEDEAEWMKKYIEEGNDLFISANEIDPRFLKLFDCETNQKIAHLIDRKGNMTDTKTSIYFGTRLPLVSFQYFYYPFNDYIKKYQEDNARILGVNDQELPNFAIIFQGKGRLYVHLAPRALGNYFLLSPGNAGYLEHILNYLRTDREAVYWDEYYKRLNTEDDSKKINKDFSTFGVIMGNPSLKWAFYITLFAFAFFIFSGIKRKQRLIPVSEVETNASVDFVETMGRLYFVNKDNRNIAFKQITFFKEYIRSKYFMNSNEMDNPFVTRLAAKSELSLSQITELVNCILAVEDSREVSDEQLLQLNHQLEKFYKKK